MKPRWPCMEPESAYRENLANLYSLVDEIEIKSA